MKKSSISILVGCIIGIVLTGIVSYYTKSTFSYLVALVFIITGWAIGKELEKNE